MRRALSSAITVNLFMAVIGTGFTSTPGELRVYPQQPAVFLWTVDVDIEDSYFKRFFYNNVEFYTERNSAFQWAGGYEQRTNVTVNRRELGFTLYQITASDTGSKYKCIVDDTGDVFHQNEDAHIFLYGTPDMPSFSSDPPEAVENMQYKITCTSESTSSPPEDARSMVYNWTRDTHPLPTDRHSTSGDGGSTLTINPILREDHGKTYDCTAQESDSTFSNSGVLVIDVKYPPGEPTLQGPTEPLVEGSSSLTLTCSLTGDSLGNPPAHEYRWWNTESSYSSTQSGNTLTVADVSVNDHNGLWRCEGINTINRGPSSEHRVTVHSPANIHTDPGPSVSVLYNESLSVLCEVKARPAASISWRYEGGDTLPSGVQPQSSTRSDGKYTITSSTLQWRSGATDAERRGSSGGYRCRGSNGVGDVAESSNMDLSVEYEPLSISLNNTGPITVVEGQQVTVKCQADCNPLCSYTWTRANDDSWSISDSTLHFQNISRTDHNRYSCQATNKHGDLPASVDITVNFPSGITGFTPSSVNPIHGDTLTLNCDVTSRPESMITISNSTRETAEDMGYSLVYTFHSISVLHSGDYWCQASNTIGSATKQTVLDVQGSFHLCSDQNQNISRGVAVAESFQEQICQFANPFYDISASNWTYNSANGTHIHRTLPDGINIYLEDGKHKYQKNVVFDLPFVDLSHYGKYTMTSMNTYGWVTFTMQLTSEGPPEVPYDLLCTDMTAVSISLQWRAGYSGGSDQRFLLTFTNLDTGDKNSTVVDGTDVSRADVLRHKLTESHGIEPEKTYQIQVVAENGPKTTNNTLARPDFQGNPTVEYAINICVLLWTLLNPDSVSHIITTTCDSSDESVCRTTNITQPEDQPYAINLPEGDTFTYFFEFYDGQDMVNSGAGADESSVGIIVGCVVGVVVAAVLITVFVVLWRKGKLSKKTEGTTSTSPHYENTRELRQNVQNVEADSPEIQYENIGLSSPVDKQYDELIGSEVSKETKVYDDLGASHVETYEGLDIQNIQTVPADYESFSRN